MVDDDGDYGNYESTDLWFELNKLYHINSHIW